MSTKCPICNKTVYPLESQIYDNEAYHKSCFKCLQCHSVMGIGSVAKIKGDLYCRPCFKKIFTEKGTYASFGAKTLAKNAPVKDLIASGQVDSSLSISEPSTPSVSQVEPVTPVSTPIVPISQSVRKPIEDIIAEATAEAIGDIETPVFTPKEADLVKSFTDETRFETPAEVSEEEFENIIQTQKSIRDEPEPKFESKEEPKQESKEKEPQQGAKEKEPKQEERKQQDPAVAKAKDKIEPKIAEVSLSTKEEAKEEKPSSLPTSPISQLSATFSTNSSASVGIGGTRVNSVTPKCEVCSKSVYPMEIQTYDDCTYHKQCFKCLQCKKVMTQLGSVAKIKGDLYCKPCFKKIFSEKGSYASFGAKTLAKNAPVKDLIASGVSN